MFDPASRRFRTPPFLPSEGPPELPPPTVPTAQGVPTTDEWEDPVGPAAAAYEAELANPPELKRIPWWRKVLAGAADKFVGTSGTELGPWLRYGSENMRRTRAHEGAKAMRERQLELAKEAARRKADRQQALTEGYKAQTGRQSAVNEQTEIGFDEAAGRREEKRDQQRYGSFEEREKRRRDAGVRSKQLPEDVERVVAPMNVGGTVAYPQGPGQTEFDVPPVVEPAYYPEGAAINRGDGKTERVPKLPTPPQPPRIPGSVKPGDYVNSELLPEGQRGEDAFTQVGEPRPATDTGKNQAMAFLRAERQAALKTFNDTIQSGGDKVTAQREFQNRLDSAERAYRWSTGEEPPPSPSTGYRIQPGEERDYWFDKAPSLVPVDEPPPLSGTSAAPAAQAAPTSPQATGESDQELRDAMLLDDPSMTEEQIRVAIAKYRAAQ